MTPPNDLTIPRPRARKVRRHARREEGAKAKRSAKYGIIAVRTRSLGDIHLFTATEASLLLGMRREAFFLLRLESLQRADRGYGTVRLFDLATLPEDLKARLETLRIQHRCRTLDELLRSQQQEIRRASIERLLVQRLAPRWDALVRRSAMGRYFRVIDNGGEQWKAIRAARGELIRLSGRDMEERTVRRLADRIDAAGGWLLAPIDAFALLKSVSHRKNVKRAPTADSKAAKSEGGTGGR